MNKRINEWDLQQICSYIKRLGVFDVINFEQDRIHYHAKIKSEFPSSEIQIGLFSHKLQ